jgi:hypothetical protein
VKQATKETDARIVIDNWLRQAGWDPVDKSQVLTEVTVGRPFGGIAYPGSDNRREVLRTADGDEVPTVGPTMPCSTNVDARSLSSRPRRGPSIPTLRSSKRSRMPSS